MAVQQYRANGDNFDVVYAYLWLIVFESDIRIEY